jgi:hypothetical protein
MSVAEMKVKAMNHLVQLENENAVYEILLHLEKLVNEETQHKSQKVDNFFKEAVAQYGETLNKLAE